MSSPKRWRAMARDSRGRELLVPWHPMSRVAYVLPEAERGRAKRRIRFYLVRWVAVAVLIALVALWRDVPYWVSLLTVPMAVADWWWWTRRFTRGFERTRYEPAG